MTLIRITAPISLPVTLAEAKLHLRVDFDEDDTLIEDQIARAVAYLDGADGSLGRALEAQTLEMALDRFPASEIRLPLGPLVSVTSVKYTDPNGVEQTVSDSDYEVDRYPVEAWIVPSTSWPATMSTIDAVRIQWVAGTGCPEPVKQAILQMVGLWYDDRAIASVPHAVTDLVRNYRSWTF